MDFGPKHEGGYAKCKADCREGIGDRETARRVPVNKVRQMGLKGGTPMHFGSAATRVTCTVCKSTWLTNTKEAGRPGSWTDMNDPSVERP